LGYQNQHREWRLFQDYYFRLLDQLGGIAQFKQVRFMHSCGAAICL